MINQTNIRSLFSINNEITFLNHGSFGACPKLIFENYTYWQQELEKNPVQFITKTGPAQVEISKIALANYIGCNEMDIVFMPNPTTALNTIINSLTLQENDEILTTNQEYGAMDKTWQFFCKKTGAKYIHADIILPLQSKEIFLEQFWKKVNSNTKIIFISHITSSTALIFPVKEICKKAKELGLITIIDGAHVPGHIPLNISELKVDFYTGANHKWLLTPKGNSFLYVSKEWQNKINPLIVSWGYESIMPGKSQFQDYHQFNGTKDFSAYLTIPSCIQFFENHDWENEKKKCRDFLKYYYPIVVKQLNSEILAPLHDDFLGQICSIPIKTSSPLELKNLFFEKYKIEIAIIGNKNNNYLRISFQAYNNEKDIEILMDALKDIKSTTNLLE